MFCAQKKGRGPKTCRGLCFAGWGPVNQEIAAGAVACQRLRAWKLLLRDCGLCWGMGRPSPSPRLRSGFWRDSTGDR